MPFGPFLSQEEKDKINNAYRANYGTVPTPSKPPRNTRGGQGGSRASASTPTAPTTAPSQQSSRSGLRGRSGVTLSEPPAARINTNRGKRGDRKFVNRNNATNESAPKPEISSSVTRFDGKEYKMDDPAQTKALDAAIATERKSRPNQKFADLRGGKVSLRSNTGRSDPPPQTNPNGVEQKGTNTGFKASGFEEANGLLERLGISTSRYGDFQSNDLPNTVNTQTDYEAMGGSASDAARYYSGEGVETEITAGSTPIEQKQKEGTPELTQSGSIKSTEEVATPALGSLKRYSQEFLADRPEMPAEYSTSMVGLRAAEASKGLLYAGGKYYKSNANAGAEGENDFVEIDKAEFNQIKRSDQHAQNFLAEKIEQAKPAASTDTEQASTEAPNLTEAVDVKYVEKDRTGRYNNFNNR